MVLFKELHVFFYLTKEGFLAYLSNIHEIFNL